MRGDIPREPLKKMPTHVDESISYTFADEFIKKVLRGKIEETKDLCPYPIESTKGNEKIFLGTEYERVLEFVKLLAICHECVSVMSKEGDILYYQVHSSQFYFKLFAYFNQRDCLQMKSLLWNQRDKLGFVLRK
jgi:hypothetical protein